MFSRTTVSGGMIAAVSGKFSAFAAEQADIMTAIRRSVFFGSSFIFLAFQRKFFSRLFFIGFIFE